MGRLREGAGSWALSAVFLLGQGYDAAGAAWYGGSVPYRLESMSHFVCSLLAEFPHTRCYIHSLMEDCHDIDTGVSHPKDDDVAATLHGTANRSKMNGLEARTKFVM